jgi:Na+/proline symporter
MHIFTLHNSLIAVVANSPSSEGASKVLGLHWIDIVTLACYFLVITVIGVWASRSVKDTTDFVMPRKFGKIMMALFGFGAGTHSDQAVSVAAKSYSSGVSGIWYQWLWLFCTPFYWLIAPMMRRFRALTTADVFEARYDKSVSVLFAIVGIFQYVVNIAAMLIGASVVIEASTNGALEARFIIPIVTLLFVIYGTAGGLSAAIVTDFIQGILAIFFSFLLLPYVLHAVGGMPGLHEYAASTGRTSLMTLTAPEEITAFYVFVLSLNGLIGIVAQPHILSNCAAGKTEFDGQFGFVAGNFLKRLCTIAWCLIGVAGVAYVAKLGMEDQVEAKSVFGFVAGEILPNVLPGLLGLFLAGLIAAVMSTCDAYMVCTAGLFTENIYKPLIKKYSKEEKSERHYLLVARAAAVGVVGLGVLLAYQIDDPVKALVIFWKIAPMMGIAFWLGLFWRRATPKGAWASSLAGFGTWWMSTQTWFIDLLQSLPQNESLQLVLDSGDGPQMNTPWQMLYYLSSAVIAGVVISMLTKPVDHERLERFYSLVRTPVGPGEPEVESPCTLPDSVTPAPRKKLIPLRQFEIYRPAPRQAIGFIVCWGIVLFLVWIFVRIIS